MKIITEIYTIGDALYKCLEAVEPEHVNSEKDIANAVNELKELFDEITTRFEKALKDDDLNAIETAVIKTVKNCDFDSLTDEQKDLLNLDSDTEYFI